MQGGPKYLLVIDHYVDSIANAVAVLRQRPEYRDLSVVVLTLHPEDVVRFQSGPIPVIAAPCGFDDDDQIAAALSPYRDGLCGVICRGDKQIQYLRRVVPHLPPQVLVATAESLEIATDKRLMRAAFQAHAPEITPQFMQVHDASAASVAEVERRLGYPVIVKPANLVSSLLIQSCHNRAELETALGKVFARIHGIYEREGRRGQPQVIVEEYLEGDFYSIDAFIMESGQVYFCPPVGYVPAKQLGIDDFFLYKRFIPTTLSDVEVAAANEATAKSLAAVGLTHSAAHVELVLTNHGWKIIEIGPRLGRFRRTMYGLGYGIDHSLNDVKIHLGIEPEIPATLQEQCSAYSIYPRQEGRLRALHGLEVLRHDPRVHGLTAPAKPGDDCHFAKHGGHALAEFIVADSDPHAFAELTRYIETEVHADIDE